MEKQDDISIADDVVLAFGAGFAGLACSDSSIMSDEVIEGDYFGPDESLLKITMDLSCSLGGFGIPGNHPGARFHFSSGEIGDEAESVEGFFDQAVEACLLHAEGV